MGTDVSKLLEEANRCFFKNDYETAERLYLEVLERETDHPLCWQRLARIETARGGLEKAVAYYERSLAAAPDDVNAWNDLGNLHYDRKRFDEAVRCYRRAFELNGEYYWAAFNIGLAVRQLGPAGPERDEEARGWFERALRLNPDYYPALNEIGLYHLERDSLDEADGYFRKAIALSQAYKFPYFNRSIIARKRGNDDEARALLEQALACDPRYVPALNNLGILHYDRRDFRRAAHYFARALEADGAYLFAIYNMGLVFISLGAYGKARRMFEKAAAVDPGYANAVAESERLQREIAGEPAADEPLSAVDLDPDTYRNDDPAPEKREPEPGERPSTAPLTETGTARNEQPETQYFTEKYGRNITRLAREGKLFDVIGREKEIRAVMEVLLKIKKNNPLVVGRACVGKTAVVEGLALEIAAGDVPRYFRDKEILEVNMGMLVAGTQFRGDFEKRLSRIVEEVSRNERLILFIDEMHTVLGAGETIDGSLDAANILKPALARGELRCIGATTTEEFNKHFIRDQAFLRRFYPVPIGELDATATLAILKGLKPRLASHYGLAIEDRLLELIVELAGDEIKNRVFPDKAIDVLENACSRRALDGAAALDEATVKKIVGEFVGMKFLETEDDHGARLLQMETFLKERVYGQDEAIEKTARIVRLTKQKLDLKPAQPDGVFLFSGPTGVGKTHLARQLAQFLFGAEEKCLILNMSEFSEPHSVAKLIGSPPGYVGHDDVPYFSRTILEHPSSLLLLDEIEKAHPEVLKLLLEIFEEGLITDTRGREIYFSNVTVVMTSNAGCRPEAGIGFQEGTGEPREALADHFPAEFLARIDEIINFKPIDRDTARRILGKLVLRKAERAFARKGIEIDVDPLFLEFVLERGYSLKYGVRNLERTFEKEVLAEIAARLYHHPHAKKITVSRERGSIAVHEAGAARPESTAGGEELPGALNDQTFA